MADYCTQAEVMRNLKQITVGSDTGVTTTALAEIITQESAVIDAHIQTNYTLPITGDSALQFLKRICITLCVYRCTLILQPENQYPIPEGMLHQDISHQSAYRDAMRMLEKLMMGKITLPAEPEKAVNLFSSSAVANNDCYKFRHDRTQW